MIAAFFFWLAIALVGYANIIYPVLMVCIGRFRKTPLPENPVDWPSVGIVVAAHDEEKHIIARIRNLLALDYPGDRLRIYIGSDGSSDRTVELASSVADERLRVFEFADRRGKASVLNDVLAEVPDDVVVFTDANTLFSPDAVKALARHFSDPAVGAVSGELVLAEPSAGDNRDSVYWRMESMLKRGESAKGGLLGANGGIYAIRRELYEPIAADTIVDDFTIVMNVSARGFRTVFDAAAIAYEDTPDGIDVEFRRRVRIGTGNYQAFFRHPQYWRNANWTRRFTYVSHKVLRWFTPHLLLVALVATIFLSDVPLYRTLLFAQLAGYALLSLGLAIRSHVRLPRLATIPVFVFAVNLAFLLGFWRYLRGSYSGLWLRTERA